MTRDGGCVVAAGGDETQIAEMRMRKCKILFQETVFSLVIGGMGKSANLARI